MKEPFLLFVMDIQRAITYLQGGENLQNFPESSNWKIKVYLPEDEKEPYWKPLKFMRNSKVTKLRSDSLNLNVEDIGKISSRFSRTDSVSSIESIEEIDEEPWLRLWQPYDDQYDANLPSKPPGLTGTFDLYIDGIRLLPQNICVSKISGLLLNLPMSFGGPPSSPPIRIEALPVLDSFTRYPQFKFKLTINEEQSMLNPNAIILLKILGLEKDSGKPCIVGSCLMSIFQQIKGSPLKIGGHQIPIRKGLPDLSMNHIEDLAEKDLDQFDLLPCVTILLRLLPSSENYEKPLWYECRSYHSESCQPNQAECNLFRFYFKQKDCTLKKNVQMLMNDENATNSDMKRFIENKLGLSCAKLSSSWTSYTNYSEIC